MDLIYADKERKDLGVMSGYNMDMAFGVSENDFECAIDRDSHCCEAGYILYVEDEEYGGIIDSVAVDTGKDVITYGGRTWHGVLENKIICPEAGQDYLVLNGEANAVLQELIENMKLQTLFRASEEDSGIRIVSYQMNRYISGYTGIRKMLKDADAKLKIRWNRGMVEISAVPRIDYSQDEEFDDSQVDFTIKKNYLPVNHIICLGIGDLRERAVIHVFTDENGGVQQYSTKETPLQDSDYILDERNQVLFGQNEVVEVLDYPNADITYNFILLETKPSDWATKYEEYFKQKMGTDSATGEEVATGEFEAVKADSATAYKLLKAAPADWTQNYGNYFIKFNTGLAMEYRKVEGASAYVHTVTSSKPSDWEENYGGYYEKSGSEYVTVKGVVTEKYSKQTKKPSDWAKNWGDYYYSYNDGTKSEYKRVEGITKYSYAVQTKQPTDWDSSCTSYFKKKKGGGYESVKETNKKAPKWKAKTYYTRTSYQVAPSWSERTRYTYSKTEAAPVWKASTYYIRDTQQSAPTFATNKYYEFTDTPVAPPFLANTFYRRVSDQYAVMIAEAVERLGEHHASDELSIALEETEQTYDIGDLVGTREEKTGIESVQEVVKKIIEINDTEVSITYEVN